MMNLVAIRIDDVIIYKDYVLRYVKGNWVCEHLWHTESNHVNHVNREIILGDFDRDIGDVCSSSTQCTSSKMCCFIPQITHEEIIQYGGRRKYGGTPPNTLNTPPNTPNTLGDKLILKSDDDNTTTFYDLPHDIIKKIKNQYENEIRINMNKFHKNHFYKFLQDAIQSSIGLHRIKNLIFDPYDMKGMNIDVNRAITRVTGKTNPQQKIKDMSNLFKTLDNQKSGFLTKELINTDYFTNRPNKYISLVTFFTIYNEIKILITKIIDKCIEYIKTSHTFTISIMFTASNTIKECLFSATLKQLNDDERKLDFTSIFPSISIQYKISTKKYTIIDIDDPLTEEAIRPTIKLIKINAFERALYNLTKLNSFDSMSVFIPDEIAPAAKLLFQPIISNSEIALKDMSETVQVFKKSSTSLGGGNIKKMRLNEYVIINGRKKRLYKGVRGGLYTMEKGQFKRMPK